MPDHILTREEYLAAVERHFTKAKENIRGRLFVLSRRIFRPQGLAKFDFGEKKYGAWDLRTRNLIQEGNSECFDWLNYEIAELERKDRGL
jgi:hypothetical protein